ncbi:MAG: helix-turn-helix domain-containing protein [Candidatus Micrarchaeota archaeon]
MWVAELKVWHEGSAHLELSKRYDVEVYAHYLNAFTRGKNVFLSRVLYVTGRDAREFINQLGKEKRIAIEGVSGNQVFYTIKVQSQYHSLLCGNRVFFLKPNRVRKGFEYWIVGAWRKRDVNELVRKINSGKPRATAELMSIKSEEVNLFAPQALAGLTGRQAYCLAKAFENGYYEYPHRNSVKRLAALAGMPRTTFQEHLQKAETKLLSKLASQAAGHPKN